MNESPQSLVAECSSLFSRVNYNVALNELELAKSKCLELIKLLNQALKTNGINDLEYIKQLSQESIELYQRIKTNSKFDLSYKILWLSSSLRGNFYPPIVHKRCHVESNKKLDDFLHLSATQQGLLEEWISIDEQDWSLDGLNHIYQDGLQDCSFVASVISYSRNNASELLRRITPHSNNSKRFGVILNLNGCERLVEVGNSLPKLRDKSLHITSRTNPNLYWPAFVEKAYLKILGNGYESRGSNASLDTFLISGWIPQFVSSLERPNMDELWTELYDDFKQNNLVLALGTGDVTSQEFHPNHDYAIVDLVKESKSIILKNPWQRNIAMIKFSDIFESFDTLYLNWNPLRFSSHVTLNFIWNKPDKTQDLYHNKQLSLHNTSARTADVWILLEKHMGFDDSMINATVYQSGGEKVFSKSKLLAGSQASNTRFHLTKFQLSPNEKCTVVILNDSNQQLQNFTLHSYSTEKVVMERAAHRYPHLIEVESEWDVDCCGGNWSNQSYLKNPQYLIEIPKHHKTVKLLVTLSVPNEELINASIYWFDEEKTFSNKPLSNEKYHAGSVFQELEVAPGQKYTLIVSTYSPDVLSKFKLQINSELPILVERIPTRLGLFIKTFKFSWNNKNRFKAMFTVSRSTKLNIHVSSNVQMLSQYRPKIRASLFYSNGGSIQVNNEFDDSFYGIWLRNISVRDHSNIILLVERFERGDGEVFVEIGSDFKIELLS